MKKCIVCNKKLNEYQTKYCSYKCRKVGMRVYSKKHYKNNKKKYIKYMKEYYKTHNQEIKLNSKIQNRCTKKDNHNYNKPRKNEIRQNIIKYLNIYNIKTILTLESKDFIFSKLVPEKKVFVFESNINTYKEMVKAKPKNVKLFLGDISEFKELEQKVDFVYLDFCSTINTIKDVFFYLKETIKQSKLFAVTLCPWCKWDNIGKGDYTFIIINEIQNITETNWKVLYGETYKDTMAMVTILFENPNYQKC